MTAHFDLAYLAANDRRIAELEASLRAAERKGARAERARAKRSPSPSSTGGENE